MTTRSKAMNTPSPAAALPSSSNITQLIQAQLKQQNEVFGDLLKKMEDRIMQRFSEFKAEITNLKSEVQMLTNKQSKLSKRCDDLSGEVEKLKLIIDKQGMESVSSDVLILNMPSNVDGNDVFGKITNVLKCENIIPLKVFKTKNEPANSIPVIAKLKSATDRSNLFRALAEFRKINKRALKLKDLNIGANENVSIFECLSPINEEILQSALTFKRNKFLATVFSLRGIVYVKRTIDGKAIKVQTLSALSEVVGGTS